LYYNRYQQIGIPTWLLPARPHPALSHRRGEWGLELLSKAIGEVELELDFREPGTPPPDPKQLVVGKTAVE